MSKKLEKMKRIHNDSISITKLLNVHNDKKMIWFNTSDYGNIFISEQMQNELVEWLESKQAEYIDIVKKM